MHCCTCELKYLNDVFVLLDYLFIDSVSIYQTGKTKKKTGAQGMI